jgi:hypothetical protein
VTPRTVREVHRRIRLGDKNLDARAVTLAHNDFPTLMEQDESGYIPGIFNYCDRWCERCAFTLRCRTYAMESSMRRRGGMGDEDDDGPEVDKNGEVEEEDEESPTGEDRDEANADFWEALSESYGMSREELDEMAEGLSFELTEDELKEAEETERRQDARAVELGGAATQSAQAYAWKMREFFKAHPELEEMDAEAFHSYVASPSGNAAETKGRAVLLWDAIEIILWHEYFIQVKLHRAYHSRAREEESPPDWPADSDGTAKVVLIALDRCIAAWAVVQELLPQHAQAAVGFMVRLDRLRERVTGDFPKAREFVRPGLDEAKEE